MHPRTLFVLLLSLLCFSDFSFGQSKKIKGQVFFFGSKSQHGKIKFVKNAKISSPLSDAVYSDNKGRFDFLLKGAYPDEPIFFQVKKRGYEVVDHKDLQYFFMDKKPRLRIFLAPKGYVKRVRSTLVGSAQKTIKQEKTLLLELLAEGGDSRELAFKTLEKRIGKQFHSTFDAEEIIATITDKLTKAINHTSYELAIINPDYSTELFTKALSHYRQEEPYLAISKLQEEKWDDDVEELNAMLEKNKKRPLRRKGILSDNFQIIERIKHNYLLQIIALQQTFRLKEANAVLLKLQKIHQLSPTHKYDLIIEELNIFKSIAPSKRDENIVLENISKPFILSEAVNEDESKDIVVDYQNEEVEASEELVEEKMIPSSELTKDKKESQPEEEYSDFVITEEKPATPVQVGTKKVSEYSISQNKSSNIRKTSNSVPTSNTINSAKEETQMHSIQPKGNHSNDNSNIVLEIKTPDLSPEKLNGKKATTTITITTSYDENGIANNNTSTTTNISTPNHTPTSSNPLSQNSQETAPEEREFESKGTTTKSIHEATAEDFENVMFPFKGMPNRFKTYLKGTPTDTQKPNM